MGKESQVLVSSVPETLGGWVYVLIIGTIERWERLAIWLRQRLAIL